MPGLLYVCVGLNAVLVYPSPKFHECDVILPLDRFVKLTTSGAFQVVGLAEKLAVGGGRGGTAGALTVTEFVAVDDPAGPETVSVTVYTPGVL